MEPLYLDVRIRRLKSNVKNSGFLSIRVQTLQIANSTPRYATVRYSHKIQNTADHTTTMAQKLTPSRPEPSAPSPR